MATTSQERMDSISASIPIHVSWTDRNGKSLSSDARTVSISRAGATIVLAQKLDPPQEIRIRDVEASRESCARVLGVVGGDFEWRIYGVVFVDAAADFWGKELPPDLPAETGRPKVCLECASCSRRAIVSLNDIEDEVLKVRQLTNRMCETCATWTVWSFADYDASPERDNEVRTAKSEVQEEAQAQESGANKRKQVRIQTKANACVRYRGVKEEVVRVKDASRGGFRFVSEHYYDVGFAIDVAMPYTVNAANIFVPARIMWRREIKRLDRLEYGVAYTQAPKKAESNMQGRPYAR